ncbi:MAG TPA: SCO family protein [Gammaproteobacteria bacterium]|nr:SCO family protein [Gammaproteobacteria bacterium]
MSPRFALLSLVLAAVALALGAASAHWLRMSGSPSGALVLDPPRPMPELDLLDHQGRPFDRARLAGRWSVLFFGFTRCPDICPATLIALAGASGRLDDLPPGQQPQVVFVSVDPMRDDPGTLARYVPHFDPDFTGVTGELPAVQTLTDALGVAVSYRRQAEGDYSVDHTAAVFLVDPQARLRAIFTAPHEAAQLARDYRRIVAGRG